MTNITEEDVLKVRMARWEGWQKMAAELRNHHILSVELVRTRDDETAAVFTVVRRHHQHQHLVQYIVRGDARGRVPRPKVKDQASHGGYGGDHAALKLAPSAGSSATAAAKPDDPTDPNAIPLGEPPVKEEPPPGIAALGAVLLGGAFDVGEQLPGSGPPQ